MVKTSSERCRTWRESHAEYDTERKRVWREANRERIAAYDRARRANGVQVAQNRLRRDGFRAWIAELRLAGCSTPGCGGPGDHFHHRDPATKLFCVSNVGKAISWRRLRTEVAKCDLLCVSCHHSAHWPAKP